MNSMNNNIANTLNSLGWKEIEKMVDKLIDRCGSLSDLPEDASDEVVAREARVRGETAKIIKKLMSDIKLAGVEKKEIKPRVLI